MAHWESIPGETPLDDISGLKIKGITARNELNYFEGQNISKAVNKYLAAKPSRASAKFDFSWSMKLHAEMFGDVWKWAGEARMGNKNIGVDSKQVAAMLFALIGDLSFWEEHKTMSLLEQAVQLHHRAVQIHPFENGNGRWARMLANIWLKLHDHPITEWPEGGVGTESQIRTEYLVAIKEADGGRYSTLLALHRRFTRLPKT